MNEDHSGPFPTFADLTDENLAQAGYETLEETLGQYANTRDKDVILSLRTFGIWAEDLYLTKLPPKLALLKEAAKANLTKNRFSTIPDEICQLGKLEELLLSENLISSLPVALGNLQNLKKLDLQKNRLPHLSDTIGKLDRLVSLNVSENEIETITEAIGKLKRLATLDLAGNRLSDLPDSLGKLHQLKSLDLSKNRLNKLPAAVLKLKRLESLFVGNNPINSLPDLCGFKKLAEVDITNTNLCPEEIEKLVGPDVEITKIPENFESDLPQLNRRCLWAMYKLWFMGNPDANPSEMPSFVKTMGDKWRPVGET